MTVIGAAGCPAGQWGYQAFNNPVLVGPTAATGCESTVTHGWGSTAPFPGVNADGFSVSWEADVSFPGTPVNFIMRSDDGVRLYLDNVVIFDDWTIHAEQYDVVSLTVPAGIHAVRYEYFDFLGNATATLAITEGPPPPTTTTIPAVTTTTTTTPPPTTAPPAVTPMISTVASSPANWDKPDGVAVDSAGNVYVLATEQNRVFKVTPLGAITVAAGTGTAGFSGDSGPAIAARLDSPSGIAVSSTDELYIADSANRRIRKVSAAGFITTVAGTGAQGSSGDGGPPVAARFDTLEGIAVRPDGRLLVADSKNKTIREIDLVANTITTVFGNGTDRGGGDGAPAIATGLKKPVDVTAHDTFFDVVDNDTGKIWEVTADGIAHFIGGGGSQRTSGSLATTFDFRDPVAISVADELSGGHDHDLLVLDLNTSRLWRIDRTTGRVYAEAGTGSAGNANPTGPAILAELDSPQDIVSTPGVDYIADSGNKSIRKIVR